MSTKTPALKQTKEYRLFKVDCTNRSPRKLTRLMASMKQWGFLPGHPIACVANGAGMVIKDGQHRFEAAKALQIPVFYVCHESHDGISIPEINNATAGAWTASDYVESFCNQGNLEYVKLREFVAETKIAPQTAASLLYGYSGHGGNIVDIFRGGKFKVRDMDNARRVACILNAAQQYVKWSRVKGFVDAVSRVARVEGFCATDMADKINRAPGMLVLQPNADSFLTMLEEIYNYRAQKRLPLKFMALEEGKRRSIAKRKV